LLVYPILKPYGIIFHYDIFHNLTIILQLYYLKKYVLRKKKKTKKNLTKTPDVSNLPKRTQMKNGEDGDPWCEKNCCWIYQHSPLIHITVIYHLVMTNIAMENPNHKWRFVAGKIIYKWTIFHGYVK